MTETTSTTATATKKAVDKTATAVSNALPTVTETVEVAMEVPAKVVLNQKLVVAVSLLTGAGLTAGALFAVNKWKAHKSLKKGDVVVPNDLSGLDDEAKKA